MPPLLQRLTERKPETLDYLGVSYGLTPQLLRYVYSINASCDSAQRFYRFWKRAGYVPLYLRQTTSELTGEHTCVMVRGLNSSQEMELEWLGEFAKGESYCVPSMNRIEAHYLLDFRRRFVSLLSFKFREFGSVMALSVLEAANQGVKKLDGDSSRGECLRNLAN